MSYIKTLTSETNGAFMKIIFIMLLQTIFMNNFAQLQPITSGVFHWNDLPVKKDKERESRKIFEGSTPEFEYFEIHATTQYKGALPRPPHTHLYHHTKCKFLKIPVMARLLIMYLSTMREKE